MGDRAHGRGREDRRDIGGAVMQTTRSTIALAAWLSMALAVCAAWGVVLWAISNVVVW